MRKSNRKKGLTLIEILISLAILSILVIPVSNMIITSVKINKSSEDKQKAVTIAQQLVEEIKALPEITNNKTLNNGLVIRTDTDVANQKGFIGTIQDLEGDFQANITIKPKDNLEIDKGKANELAYDADITINGTQDNLNITVAGDSTKYSITEENFKIENNDLNLRIGRKTKDGALVFEEYKKITYSEEGNRKVRVKFSKDVNLTNNFVLNVLNNSSKYISIYFEVDSSAIVNSYSLYNEGGVVRKYTNVNETMTKVNDSRVYEILVEITKGGRKIYEAKAYKSII